ncbi:LLM class flavin-dependent oxidoreductase [Actinopolymorpha singaporensis]|nr:LLM class flavin-dependent oxidoreductase [Actinopolymorpha singaporensis]
MSDSMSQPQPAVQPPTRPADATDLADASSTGRIPISVLELAPVGEGHTSAEALNAAATLAQRAEELGYRRFWVAEHHNMPGVASTSPGVFIGHLAARTRSIRVGSGGVMLPNHPPLVVAEQFAMLEALSPGRIDLGIGRAPGTDPATAAALRRTKEGLGAEDFPQELADLLDLLGIGEGGGRLALRRMSATPVATSAPDVWLLGSSGYSAQVAGMLGLPFAFAHHFSAANTLPAMELYRSTFRPSARLAEPYAMVTQSAYVADTAEEAEAIARPARLAQVSLYTGRPRRTPTPEEAAAHEWTDAELRIIEQGPSRPTIGDPKSVLAELSDLVAATGANELMVTTMTHGLPERLRSFELLAQAWTGGGVKGGSRAG